MCLADHCSLVVIMDSPFWWFWSSLCVMKSRDNSCLAGCQAEVFFFKFSPVLWSPLLFISGLSMTPVPLGEIQKWIFCLPDGSVYFHRFSWYLFSLTFLNLYWGLQGSWFGGGACGFWLCLSPCIVWLCYPFDMMSVIWSVRWLERKIVFEVQRGESVLINKMDARSWVAASWHCTKMKCLRFLPSCGGRSFGVRALAIGSTFPLTTQVFSLLLHPSALNSWTCTSLTATSNKKASVPLFGLQKVYKMVGKCLRVLQPATRGLHKCLFVSLLS